MISHDEGYYQSRRPVEDLGEFRNFARFIWNPEKRAFLDRTAKEWGEVGIFYLFFFGILFALFAFQLWLTLYYIGDLKKPFIQHSNQVSKNIVAGKRSLFYTSNGELGHPEGLGFMPNIIQMSTSSPIIWISENHTTGKPKRYITAITKFLEDYHRNRSNYDDNCPDRVMLGVRRTKPCFFDITTLGKCSQMPYGYESPYRPCVFIKLNKRFDWFPHYYNKTSELPENMPTQLKEIVKSSDQPRVWLSCNGINNVDKEHMGEISYQPSPGFSTHYFPYTGHSQYLPPIVAIQFLNLTRFLYILKNFRIFSNRLFKPHVILFVNSGYHKFLILKEKETDWSQSNATPGPRISLRVMH